MEAHSSLLAPCMGNPRVNGGIPSNNNMNIDYRCSWTNSRFAGYLRRHLANLSLLQGIFHNQLKKSPGVSNIQSKTCICYSNYRPITLLSTFSKIIVKLIYDRPILDKYQFGFRSNHSTYMALVILLENLRNVLDNGECAIGIFLAFEKAFDTVDHCIFLDKPYIWCLWYNSRKVFQLP